MAAFTRFKFTSFSEHIRVDAIFIKQRNYFLLGTFLFKESPKQHIPSFSLPWGEGIRSLLFIITFHHWFSSLLSTPSLFKNFSSLAKHKDFAFFQATLSTLNIIYIRLIYIKKAHLGLHSNNETAALKTKTISRSLLKNLILQNCLHRLNIWGCGYYTKTD